MNRLSKEHKLGFSAVECAVVIDASGGRVWVP